MIIEFNRRFLRDLDKITRASVKKDVLDIIDEVKIANTLSEIKNLKNLKGIQPRIGLEVAIIESGFLLKIILSNLPGLLTGRIFIKYFRNINMVQYKI
ncbi:hypothetical protein [Mucilaginibacter gotjawali]|uniref:Uncharacterized protein n=2 Tax=Mucilaginibacter gotjawali TaxID=1550579 RepID=A0A0X8X0L9_9SPHI|nr:hypothetical protein [Mucilaginibacter gotjawali]MBB3056039.1 hypothetical protein [Mucilaginibacter gotjawali]BAU53625.1 hypothetical protein MgSA37_01794 [Mucilaginibacter gotjawali]